MACPPSGTTWVFIEQINIGKEGTRILLKGLTLVFLFCFYLETSLLSTLSASELSHNILPKFLTSRLDLFGSSAKFHTSSPDPRLSAGPIFFLVPLAKALVRLLLLLIVLQSKNPYKRKENTHGKVISVSPVERVAIRRPRVLGHPSGV